MNICDIIELSKSSPQLQSDSRYLIREREGK